MMNTHSVEAVPEVVDEVVRMVDELTDKPSSGPVDRGVIMIQLFDQNIHPDLADDAIDEALMAGRIYEPGDKHAYYKID